MVDNSPSALPLTEDLKRELLQDPLLKATLDLLEGSIVRVTEIDANQG
jgi:hypothetical protein